LSSLSTVGVVEAVVVAKKITATKQPKILAVL
jgi:hypothetical protein